MDEDPEGFPAGSTDERELLLQWLGYLRGAVVRNIEGLDDDQARWTPDGKLISLIGIVNHLTRVEWRWIEGGFGGVDVTRNEDEFRPGSELTVAVAVDAYRRRAIVTDSTARSMDLATVSDPDGWGDGHDLRWILFHLINETARHAGHADATREMLDGKTGE